MLATETMVRMGELAVSGAPGDVLVSLGLGSCIGLAIVDRRGRRAGLAHVVLPQSNGQAVENPLKFAEHAVPELHRRLVAVGARRSALEAVLVGGASMFAVGTASMEVGQRNEAAVRDALARLRLPVRAAACGGSCGRTIRVDVAAGTVTVREAGGETFDLLGGED
jgi:chemotaxis protein CheD